MKKSVFITLVVLSLIILAIRFGTQPAADLLNYQPRAGIKITSIPESEVYLNGERVGKTPYSNEQLKVEDYQIKLITEQSSWESQVSLNKGAITVVNRELSPTQATSAGEILNLSPGKGVVLSSKPDQAEVEIDGKLAGKTPLSVSDLEAGEHNFIISQDNFLKRSIQAQVPPGSRLTIDVDLALIQSEITPQIQITPEATGQEVTVGETPNGFLRVRDEPSLNGKEIARVLSGEKLIRLSEQSGWAKIKLKDGNEGYVSADYLE